MDKWWLCPECGWEGDEAAFTLSLSVVAYCPDCNAQVDVHPDLMLQPSGYEALCPAEFEVTHG